MQVSITSPTASPVTFAGGRVLLNVCPMSYYQGYSPVLNWWVGSTLAGLDKASGNIGAGNDAGVIAAGLYTADYELASPLPEAVTFYGRKFLDPLGPSDSLSGEEFTITWEGTATVTFWLVGTGGTSSVDNVNKTATLTPGSGMSTNIEFRNIDINDPPRNIKIYQSRYAANVANGEIFNPDWLDEVKKFGRIRFMDWMGTNGSPITEFSQFATASARIYISHGVSASQVRSGIPLSLIVELANQTGCDVHVCIPHKFGTTDSDVSITDLATYFRDNITTDSVVTYEYTNEPWNSAFAQRSYLESQGALIAAWSGQSTFTKGCRYYGYRAAQIMKTIRDVYGVDNRSRWRGCLGTQCVNPGVTDDQLTGVNYYLSNVLIPADSLAVSDLFDEIAVTGYFGDVQTSAGVKSITLEPNALVTTSADGHNFQVGDRVRFAMKVSDGMGELCWKTTNPVIATVTEVPTTPVGANTGRPSTFRIDIDTSSYTALIASPQGAYAHNSKLFDLMDASEQKWTDGLTSTKYQYFNEQASKSFETGADDGGLLTTSVYVSKLKSTYWPNQKTRADANGLELTQYEGGCHFVGHTYLAGWTGDNPLGDRLTEFLVGLAHSSEVAAIYSKMFRAFYEVGGVLPSKFYDGGTPTRFGIWGGFRYLPEYGYPDGDTGNPVWKATKAANAVYFAP